MLLLAVAIVAIDVLTGIKYKLVPHKITVYIWQGRFVNPVLFSLYYTQNLVHLSIMRCLSDVLQRWC